MEMKDDDIDKKMRQTIAGLDEYYPENLPDPDKMWQKIVARTENKRAQRTIRNWQIAASFTFILTASVIWQLSNTEKNVQHLTSSTEMISDEEREALEYINKLCKGNSITCTSQAFMELQHELTASASTLRQINKQLTMFGTDENLLKAQTRVKRHQARIIKAMVQTL